MTPNEFTFTFIVPKDPQLVDVVRAVAAHAVSYAKIDEAAGQAFVVSVAAAAGRWMPAGQAGNCELTFGCDNGVVHVSFGGETVRSA